MLQTWSKSVVVSRFDPRTSHSQNDALKEDLLALPTNRLWSPGQQGCLANVCFMVTMFLKFVSAFTHWCWYRIGPAKKKVAKITTPCLTPPSRVPGAPAVVAAWKQDISGVESKLFQGWTNRTKYQDDSNDYVMILLRVLIALTYSETEPLCYGCLPFLIILPRPHTLWIPKLVPDGKRSLIKHSIQWE